MRCIKFLIFPLLLISMGLRAQKSDEIPKELPEIDYLTYKYKHLDKDYKIHMPSDLFQETMKKYEYFPQKIKTYSDSLSVVLMGEFDNWKQANIATNRLAFTDLRSSYYLWISPARVKELRVIYGFDHPYRFYQYFRFQEDQWDEKMHQFMKNLRTKVDKASDKPNVLSMTSKYLLREALLLSPQRVIDSKKKVSKRSKWRFNRR